MFSSPLTSFPFIFAILGASTAASTTHTANVARGVESSSDICLVSKPIRCLPSRGLRNLEAGTAVNSLAYGRVPMEGFNIEAGTCIHHITGYTCAQVCNYTPEDRVVSQKEVFLALENLRMDCGADHFSGGHVFDNLSAYIYGIGGADDVDPETAEKDVFTGEINMVKRAVVTDSKFKNGVLSITVDQSPKSRAEVEALGRNFDPCDHDNGFTGESIWGCNKRPPNKDGSCDFRYKNNNRDCAAWCEVRRRYFHGLERPYNVETINRGPGAFMVTLTKGTSTSWGVSYGLNLGLADPLSRFSGGLGFSIEKSCTHSLDESFAPQYSEMGDWCGYWTLIPKMVESCGSMTKWHTTTLVGPNGATSPMCDASQPSRTFGNQCITYPYRKDRNRVDGNTVVVLVDCKRTNILAPMRRQNQYYRKPGVADTQSGRLKKAPGDKK
ncbi:hypothetical protein TWF106_006950 [Orbilia oligospora]|uniref:Uncharacterized protein n=1 Tax=Orbilia oligospora TaxID=2813651 RepID=A0A7C8URL8_ORBOL|nr:hypothetical protein TWF106_006950 [Orbilia oligospora]